MKFILNYLLRCLFMFYIYKRKCKNPHEKNTKTSVYRITMLQHYFFQVLILNMIYMMYILMPCGITYFDKYFTSCKSYLFKIYLIWLCPKHFLVKFYFSYKFHSSVLILNFYNFGYIKPMKYYLFAASMLFASKTCAKTIYLENFNNIYLGAKSIKINASMLSQGKLVFELTTRLSYLKKVFIAEMKYG